MDKSLYPFESPFSHLESGLITPVSESGYG